MLSWWLVNACTGAVQIRGYGLSFESFSAFPAGPEIEDESIIRNAQQTQQAREELRSVVGYSVADEITKLEKLKKSGSITDDEFKLSRQTRLAEGTALRCLHLAQSGQFSRASV
ncbi:MAG: hypothetical protein WBW99_06595 [Pseudolabrys sp.]